MKDDQKDCFMAVYNHLHDERSSNANLVSLIEICFPDPEENEVSRALHGLKSYLRSRSHAGAWIMESLYNLKKNMGE